MAQQKTASQLAIATGMQTRLIPLASALLLGFCVTQVEAGCYQLFNQAGAKIYEGTTPPFDISYPGNSPSYQSSRSRGEYMLIMPANFCEGGYAESEATRVGGHSVGSSSGNGAGACAGRKILYGPRGGAYCITATGQARYLSQD